MYRNYFLKLDRKFFFIFTARFYNIVNEKICIAYQMVAKSILEVRFFRKLQEEQRGNGQMELVKALSGCKSITVAKKNKNRLMLRVCFIHLSTLKILNLIWEELETKLWMLSWQDQNTGFILHQPALVKKINDVFCWLEPLLLFLVQKKKNEGHRFIERVGQKKSAETKQEKAPFPLSLIFILKFCLLQEKISKVKLSFWIWKDF